MKRPRLTYTIIHVCTTAVYCISLICINNTYSADYTLKYMMPTDVIFKKLNIFNK